tara:strand:- start:7895 stop:8653 length:759 start_codon:yes stop_codon:yes gene_type:complete
MRLIRFTPENCPYIEPLHKDNFEFKLTDFFVKVAGLEEEDEESNQEWILGGHPIAHMAAPGTIVFGAGFFSRQDRIAPNVDIRAIWGRGSQSLCELTTKDYMYLREQPCGFLWHLLPYFFLPERTREFDAVLLPSDEAEFEYFANQNWVVDSMLVIHPHANPDEIIHAIRSANHLQTTSPYGIMLANAYGVDVVKITGLRNNTFDNLNTHDYLMTQRQVDFKVSYLEEVCPFPLNKKYEHPRPIISQKLNPA